MKDNPFLRTRALVQNAFRDGAFVSDWAQLTAASLGVPLLAERIHGRCDDVDGLQAMLTSEHGLAHFNTTTTTSLDRFGEWKDNESERLLLDDQVLVSLSLSDDGGQIFIAALGGEARDRERFTRVTTAIRDRIAHPSRDATIHVLARGGFGFTSTPLETTLDPLVAENYTESQRAGFESVLERIRGDREGGRLFLLRGLPGTGKTYFIKALLEKLDHDTMCLLLPPAMIAEVASPEIVSSMISWARFSRALVLIIEDADQALVNRFDANMASVQSLLNLTEGILGESLNLFIIASTNAEQIDFDPALIRPGRMDTALDFELLSPEHANAILARLEGPDLTVDEPTSLARVYELSRGHESTPPEKRRVGF